MYKMLCSLIIAQSLLTTYGQTYSEMDKLSGYLFNESRYNKRIRPIVNQIMKVNFTLYLNSIDYFDISSGELLISGFFEITWTDELLTWNPSLFGGKEMIMLPKDKFWKPEMPLTNGLASDESSIYNSGLSPVWASYDGSVVMILRGSYQTRCNVDTTLYPFDIHMCNFQFIVTNHDTAEIILYSPTGDINAKNFKENGEWEIKNTYAEVAILKEGTKAKLYIPMMQVSFSLHRKPTFKLINIYMPLMLMSFHNLVTCFVRPDSGERLTFAITLYLYLFFAATAAIVKIPNNSLKMPLMSYNILITNFIYMVGVTWSIFIVHIASKSINQQKIPGFVMKMAMKRRQMHTFRSKLKPDGKCKAAKGSEEVDDFSEENKANEKQEHNGPVNDITGQELANVLDIIYFWFVLLFQLVHNAIFSGILFSKWTQ